MKERALKDYINLIVLTAALSLLGGCGAQQFKTDIFQDFYAVGWGPTAMTWSGRDLLIGDETLVMELSDIDTGRFVGETFPYNNNGLFKYSRLPLSIRSVGKISGLAWEADCCSLGYLWVADSKNRQIVKLSSSYDVLMVFATDGFVPQGLAFDGKDLWTLDASASRIYAISTENGRLLKEIVSPIQRPLGLAFDCNNLLVVGIDDCKVASSDCTGKRLVKVDVKEGKVIEEISLPRQIKKPTSIAAANDNLWVGDRILNRVFKLSKNGSTVEESRPLIVSKVPETTKPRKIEVLEKPLKEEKIASPEDSRKAVDEAKKAADEAKKAADEARDAADKAKKAFELQQKK